MGNENLNLEIDKTIDKVEVIISENNKYETESSTQKGIKTNVEKSFLKITKKLEEMRDLSPEKTLKGLFSLMDEVDKEQFVIENLIENVKRGTSLYDSVDRFNEIGLTEISLPKSENINNEELEKINKEKNLSHRGSFSLLDKLKRSLKKVYLIIIKVIVIAVKASGKMTKITPIVGFVGFVPSISFQLKAEGITVSEFFDLLTATQ